MRSKAEKCIRHIFKKNVYHVYSLSISSISLYSPLFLSRFLSFRIRWRLPPVIAWKSFSTLQIGIIIIIGIYAYVYCCSTLCKSKTHGRGSDLRGHPRSERSSECDDGVYVRVCLSDRYLKAERNKQCSCKYIYISICVNQIHFQE